MNEKELKFKQLISEIDDLILNLAPNKKNQIIRLQNKENLEDVCYGEEILKRKQELDNLRGMYLEKLKKLYTLNKEKGRSEIIKIIKKKRQIDFNIKSGFNDCYGVYESMYGDY